MAQPRLTPAQRLQRSHIALMRSPRFALLSGIILLGDSCVDDGIPTAYTDGQNKVYGRRFLNTLTDKQINFVVAHENFHVLYKHITTWQGLWKQNPRLANVACDYVINQQILDLDPEGKDIELPDLPLCIDEQYRGWNAHQVYEHLKQQHEESSEDEHDNDPDSFDEHGFDAAQSMSDQARRDLHQAIDRAARQGNSLASQLNATTAREIGAISEPQVDWRSQLQDFVQSVCAGRTSTSWRRPNRRWLANDVYMPTPFSEAIGPMVIGVDTSSSIDASLLNRFLSEIVHIAQTMPPERIHLLYWDTEIAREEVYVSGEYEALACSTKPVGGGATDAGCVKQFVDAMNTKPELVLMLTDGYLCGAWPCFNEPALWLSSSDQKSPYGKTIHIQ